MLVGLLVNGPYALITTAVSAELGIHPSLRGSSKALATVTSIIDGTGSIGAAIGPLIASEIPFESIFHALMLANVLALLVRSSLEFISRKKTFWRYFFATAFSPSHLSGVVWDLGTTMDKRSRQKSYELARNATQTGSQAWL